MTALTDQRDTVKREHERSNSIGVAASTKIQQGSLVADNGAGFAVPAAANVAFKVLGRAEKEVDNTSGAAGDLSVEITTGTHRWVNNGTSITIANRLEAVYAVDDQTVDLNSNGGLRPFAGVVLGVETNGVFVFTHPSLSVGAGGVVSSSNPNLHAVLVATTADITLSAPQTVNGVAVVAGNRVLVKDQSSGEENGIYVVAAAAWTRATDADGADEIVPGMYVHVSEGTADPDEWYFLETNAPITIDTTVLVFTKMPSLAELAATTAGNGAALVGVQDAAANFAGTDVEAVLAEIIADYAAITTGNGASKLGLEDSGTFTTAADAEAAFAELYQHLLSATSPLKLVSLYDLREVDTSGDVSNIAANGGLLASDTTPIMRGDAAESQEVNWVAGNSDLVAFQTRLPKTFDGTADVTIELSVSTGNTNADAATFTVETGWDGGALVSDTATDSSPSGTQHVVTATIAAADIPDAAVNLTVILTLGTHATDLISLHGIGVFGKIALATS